MQFIEIIKNEFRNSPVSAAGAIAGISAPIIASVGNPKIETNSSLDFTLGFYFLFFAGIGFSISYVMGRISRRPRISSCVYGVISTAIFAVFCSSSFGKFIIYIDQIATNDQPEAASGVGFESFIISLLFSSYSLAIFFDASDWGDFEEFFSLYFWTFVFGAATFWLIILNSTIILGA